MREKITVNLFYMGLIAALITALLTGVTLYRPYQEQVAFGLEQETHIIAAAYRNLENPLELAAYSTGDLRITLMDPAGEIIYDNRSEEAEMGNQLDRAEVQQALAEGSGQAIRRSETFGTRDHYYALLLEDGNILRLSMTANSLYYIFSQSYPVLFLVMLVVVVLSVAFTLLITRNLIKPIEKLPADLDDPTLTEDPKRVYPELVPFVKEIQAQRREREKMRQEFTANVTHELKTPLTSISGYAEMISTGMSRAEDIPRFAEKIRVESDRMLVLVNDIIELSNLDRMEALEDPGPVDLLDVAYECSDQLAASAEKQSVTIDVTGSSCVVEGDAQKLWELVYNLVDNAVRYNRKGGRVEIEVGDRSVTVRDNGIGIPEEHQGRVFERFYRVDKSHSRATGGTGLGLSIVKHIAEQHHAKLTLKSAANIGTEITVTFPPSA